MGNQQPSTCTEKVGEGSTTRKVAVTVTAEPKSFVDLQFMSDMAIMPQRPAP